jgi:hypothetical protein
MKALWFTRQSDTQPNLDVLVAGTPVPPCFVPSGDLVAAAAHSGLGVRVLGYEAGDGWAPTEAEIDRADEILAALQRLATLIKEDTK